MIQRFCDLCGKPLELHEDVTKDPHKFKIKEYKWFGDCGGWEKIDAHQECIEKLFNTLKNKKDIGFK